MVFNVQMFPKVYFTTPNIHNDENLTITIIHHFLTHWSDDLTEVLYLQLDNTCWENKNQVVFGYLNMLVEVWIFKKLRVCFLLIGHTHDPIDQMFSHFASTLRRKKVGRLPSLIEIIRKAYHPKPIVQKLEETIDMRRFIFGSHDEERCIEKLNDISFQHQFHIKNIDGRALLWGKTYSTSTKWGPTSGLSFLKIIPNCQMYASNLLLLQSFVEIHNARWHSRDVDSSQCLEEIKKCIEDKYEYFDVVYSVWWAYFFMERSDIISNSTNGDIYLRSPFTLPQSL